MKKWIVPIGILIVVITVAVLMTGKNEVLPKEPTVRLDNIDQIFEAVYTKISEEKNLANPPYKHDAETIWWISPDGWSIVVPSKLLFEARFEFPFRSGIDNKTVKAFDRSIYAINQIMTDNGFAINDINTIRPQSNEDRKGFIGYETENYMCVLESKNITTFNSPQNVFNSDPKQFLVFNFGCIDANTFKIEYEKQIPFLKMLGGKNMVIDDIIIKDDKAILDMTLSRGGPGGTVYLYKSDNEWKIVSKWNSAPPDCSEFQSRGVPVKYWTQCWDQNGKIRKEDSFGELISQLRR